MFFKLNSKEPTDILNPIMLHHFEQVLISNLLNDLGPRNKYFLNGPDVVNPKKSASFGYY